MAPGETGPHIEAEQDNAANSQEAKPLPASHFPDNRVISSVRPLRGPPPKPAENSYRTPPANREDPADSPRPFCLHHHGTATADSAVSFRTRASGAPLQPRREDGDRPRRRGGVEGIGGGPRPRQEIFKHAAPKSKEPEGAEARCAWNLGTVESPETSPSLITHATGRSPRRYFSLHLVIRNMGLPGTAVGAKFDVGRLHILRALLGTAVSVLLCFCGPRLRKCRVSPGAAYLKHTASPVPRGRFLVSFCAHEGRRLLALANASDAPPSLVAETGHKGAQRPTCLVRLPVKRETYAAEVTRAPRQSDEMVSLNSSRRRPQQPPADPFNGDPGHSDDSAGSSPDD
ncbi:hypothetical protein CMUS01_06491 [Colletotrichum musicola]|uniref:Uncharacterized protein n=1 Tax=Colletotrichum musicola TaxID=2175873 RepID=A0A8H6KLA7_9PEZI|nr:hypothetical protein CMUS01_06491 [Colletotrichum musicola]